MLKPHGFRKEGHLAFFLIIILVSCSILFTGPTCADQPQASVSGMINIDKLCWSLEDVKGKIGCSAQDFIIKASICEIEAIIDSQDDLGLDLDQRHEIAKRYRKFKRSMRLCQAKLNMATVQLSEILQEEHVDLSEVKEKIKTTKDLCSKLTDRAVSALIDMKNILTPKQREKEKKLLFPESRKSEGQYIVNPCGQ